MPAAVRHLLAGAAAGLVAFTFSRLMIAPLIDAAVDYEAEREHAQTHLTGEGHSHGHELFTRAVQENTGAAVGIVGFGIVMGVLFAVAYTAVRALLLRRGARPDPSGLAMLLATGMFVAIALMPSLKYPANPPGVGFDETVAARSSAFLTMLVVSVAAAVGALLLGLHWSRRWGTWWAGAAAVVGYVTVTVTAMVLLPSFDEVPGPVTGPDGLVLDGFPAGLLADFRLYSILNQAVLWLVIGATWACLAAWRRQSSANSRSGQLSYH